MSLIPLNTINEINRLHTLARATAADAIEYARQAGLHLLSVKKAQPHGEFGKWLEANVNVSQRQAQRYMAAAQGKAISFADLTVKYDTVSHLKDSKPALTNSAKKKEWFPEDNTMYLFSGAEGSAYWVTPSIEPAGGFHICKHYIGERLSSKDFFLHYTILSEVHDADLISQYYIGTRRPVSMKYGVGSVLQTYGLKDIEGSLMLKGRSDCYQRPVGEPDSQYWYWDVRRPGDQQYLDKLELEGHINDHGAIVRDFRNKVASPF